MMQANYSLWQSYEKEIITKKDPVQKHDLTKTFVIKLDISCFGR